jgi:hypothetical protein
MKTLIIQLFGGPGCGKSTTAAGWDNEKIYITYYNTTYEYILSCQCHMMQFINIDVNDIKQEKWNCMFNDELKSINNTYDQLQGQACTSFPIYCGN